MTVQTVLLVGATGSVGRNFPTIAEAHGLTVRAMVRDLGRARALHPDVELVEGDLEDAATLVAAVDGVDAIILTHGGNPERVDYGGIRNLLHAVGDATPRLVVMTALYVTRPEHFLNGQFDRVLDWRRRAERLVRASGLPYTIVRPSWFDQVAPGDDRLVFEQGDTGEGGVGRLQIASVLVQSLLNDDALGKTFELFAVPGAAPTDWSRMFGALRPDAPGAIDGPLDRDTLPLRDEPASIRDDLDRIRRRP